MPGADVNREAVDRHLDRLREAYAGVDPERTTVEEPPDRFEELREYARDGWIGGGYAWVVRGPDAGPALSSEMPDFLAEEQDTVLMILPRNSGAAAWGLPGGGREGDESFEEAAVREVREETGIDCTVTDLAWVERRVLVSAGDHDERLHTLAAFFYADYDGGTLEPQAGELRGVAWFAEPPGRMMADTERFADAYWDDWSRE